MIEITCNNFYLLLVALKLTISEIISHDVHLDIEKGHACRIMYVYINFDFEFNSEINRNFEHSLKDICILGTSMYYYTACNCTMCNLLLLGE